MHDFLLPAVEKKPGATQVRQEEKISFTAGFPYFANRHVLFLGFNRSFKDIEKRI
ncbi:MAG: hypothetical protein QM426_11965 [Euryarchaeota archaeon]|nr:hypothetical protein [Euryarchaeota archaeon]